MGTCNNKTVAQSEVEESQSDKSHAGDHPQPHLQV